MACNTTDTFRSGIHEDEFFNSELWKTLLSRGNSLERGTDQSPT